MGELWQFRNEHVNNSNLLKPSTTQYKKLAEIGEKDCVNVFGVVKFFKEPKPSKGTDWSCFVNIVDPTLYENKQSLKCIFFESDPKQFPVITGVGDIVIFTSLMINDFKGTLQATGKSAERFSWVSFDGQPNTSLTPRYPPLPGRECIISDEDLKKVDELRAWACNVLLPRFEHMTLAELTLPNIYFNLACQVVFFEGNVSVSCSASSCVNVIHVWDGTDPGVATIVSEHTSLCTATKWRYKVLGKCAKIFVFTQSDDANLSLKSSDFILVRNLHFKSRNATKKDSSQSHLVLHERGDHGHRIRVLEHYDRMVQELIARMESLPAVPSPLRTKSAPPRIEETFVKATVGRDTHLYYTYSKEKLSALQTATSHAYPPANFFQSCRSSINDIKLCQDVPCIFLVKARLYAYWPNNIREFVKYVCDTCESVQQLSEVAVQFDTKVNVPCSKCGNTLSLSLCVTIILRDNENFIDVVLFDDAAKSFFSNVQPALLYDYKSTQNRVEKHMRSLLSERVWVDYVISSYYHAGQVTGEGDERTPQYRITDTALEELLN